MKKETKIRFISGAMAMMLANGIVFATPVNAGAEIYKRGTFIEETVEYGEKTYLRYVADKTDNLSQISRKICRYYGVEVTTKYWPVLAFLNDVKKAIVRPGDVFIFPLTIDEMDELYEALITSGWIKAYVKANNIYKPKKKVIVTVGDLLAEIYGDKTCVDPDFVQAYLKMQGLDGVYTIDSVIDHKTDMIFYLTEWLPTVEDIEEFQQKNKTKTK